jgi:hypothetical protein
MRCGLKLVQFADHHGGHHQVTGRANPFYAGCAGWSLPVQRHHLGHDIGVGTVAIIPGIVAADLVNYYSYI